MRSKGPVSRIGIFGGTFDPPHIGHLTIAHEAVRQLSLDKILFVPAYVPPHKKGVASASPLQRLALTRLATKEYPEFEVLSLEVRRKGVSYTIDTLYELRNKYKDARLFLIVGGDNFKQIKKWKSVDEILGLVTLVVYDRVTRSRSRRNRSGYGAVFLKGDFLEISSTMIRHKIKHGETVRCLVPQSIERYIKRHRLYR